MTEHHHPLTPTQLLSFMRAQPWAIEASVSPQGAPQAAVIYVAITDRWELLFDTVTQSRKHQNLVKSPARESPGGFVSGLLMRNAVRGSCQTFRGQSMPPTWAMGGNEWNAANLPHPAVSNCP